MSDKISKVPRYRAPPGMDRLMRWSGLWRRYGNTLSPSMNRRHRRFLDGLRVTSRSGPASDAVTDLQQEGITHFPQAMARDDALALSDRFDRLAATGDGTTGVLDGVISIARPLVEFGDAPLGIFDSRLGGALAGYYGANFRIEWLDCYRSLPEAERSRSWLWHMDNVPYGYLKVMLLLTDADAASGAMRYRPRRQSRRLQAGGYFGIRIAERLADLRAFERKSGIDEPPALAAGRAGDAFVFDPNLLHCAQPPIQGKRDVMTFLVLPSALPWREALQRTGRARVQTEVGGFPPSPEI